MHVWIRRILRHGRLSLLDLLMIYGVAVVYVGLVSWYWMPSVDVDRTPLPSGFWRDVVILASHLLPLLWGVFVVLMFAQLARGPRLSWVYWAYSLHCTVLAVLVTLKLYLAVDLARFLYVGLIFGVLGVIEMMFRRFDKWNIIFACITIVVMVSSVFVVTSTRTW